MATNYMHLSLVSPLVILCINTLVFLWLLEQVPVLFPGLILLPNASLSCGLLILNQTAHGTVALNMMHCSLLD